MTGLLDGATETEQADQRQQALDRIAEMRAPGSAYHDRGHVDHDRAVTEMKALYEAANPGDYTGSRVSIRVNPSKPVEPRGEDESQSDYETRAASSKLQGDLDNERPGWRDTLPKAATFATAMLAGVADEAIDRPDVALDPETANFLLSMAEGPDAELVSRAANDLLHAGVRGRDEARYQLHRMRADRQHARAMDDQSSPGHRMARAREMACHVVGNLPAALSKALEPKA